jgi:hypothetical protein
MSEIVRRIEASKQSKRVLRERDQQCKGRVFIAKLARKTRQSLDAQRGLSAFAANSWVFRLA